MARQIEIPDGAVEVIRLTVRGGRVLVIGFCDRDGTYGYRGDGFGGRGHTLATMTARINDCREYPGGKTATATGTTALFQTEGGIY